MRRTLSKLAASFGMLITVTLAYAGEHPFNQAEFDKAVRSGKPVAVDFHADWCSTCRMQQAALEAVLAEPAMKDVTVFIADFDTERALKRRLKVTAQSTLVVFKGGKEVARSMGQTQRADLAALLKQAL